MRTRRIVYLVLGCLFIGLSLLYFLSKLSDPNARTVADPDYRGDASFAAGYRIGQFIGESLFLVIGLIFLFAAYRVQKKIKRKEMQELLESI
jgi:hypothetical protein